MFLEKVILTTPYLNLDEDFYDLTKPMPLDEPYLISLNTQCAELIGLEEDAYSSLELLALLNGNLKLKGSTFYAMVYAGHQFGNYNPWLGDGRAVHLGKVNGWNLQLKGSGETLYSRMDDGRAVIASSIREYLMSEGMYHLGIPTTRALGIVGSKTEVIRRTGLHYGAMVMRMASSWVRFGTFEYFYYRKEYDKLERLAEYVIEESYPHLINDEDRFYKMFCEILEKTAILVSKWQSVGFNHGVMNTDNMSIEGLTLDYGPFAMLDDFNYNYVCNQSDKIGRYAYGEQPNISYWNVTKFSEALSTLISKKRMQEKLDAYGASLFPNIYVDEMRKKLGLSLVEEADKVLIDKLITALHEAYVDYTLFFRTLSRYNGNREPLYDIAMNPIAIDNWLKLYDNRLLKELKTQKERQESMLKVNPKYILKNYMLDKAIKLAECGNFSMVEKLLYIASHPYDELPEFETFAGDTPQEYKNIGLSCSS